jgi:hypothetical protein
MQTNKGVVLSSPGSKSPGWSACRTCSGFRCELLFGLVTYLEIIMASAIRREFNEGEGWLQRLSKERRDKIRSEISKAKADDSFVTDLLFTQFGDKATIIRKSPHFKPSKSDFKNHLALIQKLRDGLAHANDYASSPEAASETCRTVRLIEKWSGALLKWPEEA